MLKVEGKSDDRSMVFMRSQKKHRSVAGEEKLKRGEKANKIKSSN